MFLLFVWTRLLLNKFICPKEMAKKKFWFLLYANITTFANGTEMQQKVYFFLSKLHILQLLHIRAFNPTCITKQK